MELQTNILDIGNLKNKLKLDCEKCMGLCCTALFFAQIDGFPYDKASGEKCNHMDNSYKCKVHEKLHIKGYKGCISFDCLGSGPMVVSLLGEEEPSKKSLRKLYEAFITERQVHEVLWYLADAFEKSTDDNIKKKITVKAEEIYRLTTFDHDSIIKIDVNSIRDSVRTLLSKVSDEYRKGKCKLRKATENFETDLFGRIDLTGKNMKNADICGLSLKGAVLIQTDFTSADFSYVDLIGADMRDANLCGADLSKVIYLTQMQVNSTIGNSKTKLPKYLTTPDSWK